MAAAMLQDSRGLSSLVFDVSHESVWMTIRWVAQPFGSQEKTESEIRLAIDLGRSALADLREDLRAYLHRPVNEISEAPFLYKYDFSSGDAFIGLEFAQGSEKLVPTSLAGRGLAIARYISGTDSLEIALPVDVTVLDRFCSELGDLTL